jgi:hypothetical protein
MTIMDSETCRKNFRIVALKAHVQRSVLEGSNFTETIVKWDTPLHHGKHEIITTTEEPRFAFTK